MAKRKPKRAKSTEQLVEEVVQAALNWLCTNQFECECISCSIWERGYRDGFADGRAEAANG